MVSGPGLASGADFVALTELWTLSFGGPNSYIKTLHQLVADADRTVVFREKGRTVAGAYLIDATLHIGQQAYSAYYLFGAATHPDYRKKGYMGQLIRYCRTLCEERKIDFLVLLPTDNALYKYFSRFGFRANFYEKTIQLNREQLLELVENANLPDPEKESEFVPTNIESIRHTTFEDKTYLEFNREMVQYLLFEHVLCGGKTIFLKDGYALYKRSVDDTGATVLHARELLSENVLGTLLRELSTEEADRYILTLPAFDATRGGKTSTGRAGMDLAVSKRAVKAERSMKNAYLGPTPGLM